MLEKNLCVSRTPLTIKKSPTNSFLLPRWGGIHIYNYHVAGQDNFKFPAKISVDMAAVMGIWLGQLRTLLGVRELAGVSALPVPHWGLRKLLTCFCIITVL
jgi:Phosphatidylinositol-glycan biosynthesis class S protein